MTPPAVSSSRACGTFDSSRILWTPTWTLAGTESAAEVLRLFYGQVCRKGRLPITVKSVMDTLTKFRVDPWDLAGSRERVLVYSTKNGIDRLAAAGKKKFVRKTLARPLAGVKLIRPSCPVEAASVACWAMVGVTGNRADNVVLADIVRVDEDGIKVHWNKRKVRSNVNAFYQFGWSETPPLWVRQEWKTRIGRSPAWEFSGSESLASAVNGWLRKWRVAGSSTSPRAMVDRNVRALLWAGKIRNVQYEILMDHNEVTSAKHYVDETSDAEKA